MVMAQAFFLLVQEFLEGDSLLSAEWARLLIKQDTEDPLEYVAPILLDVCPMLWMLPVLQLVLAQV